MAVDISKLVRYRSAVEDNARWADFEPREDDIFVCTPAKCGTTWTQTILTSLFWPAGDQPGTVMQLSPWVDAQFMPVEALHAALRAQTHRRYIKTHTPADGIPWYSHAKYIFVARDGRDAFMSMCNHMKRMRAELKAGLNARVKDEEDVFPLPDWDGDHHRFFRDWLAQMNHAHTVATYWKHVGEPNVLFVHYNDMKADLDGEMRHIARFLGIDVPGALWPQAVQRCTFEAMREDTQRMGTFDAFEGGLKGFIFQGTNGRWRDVLTAEELRSYDEKVGALLTPEAAAWMAEGRSRLESAANP
jgi:aryl sulfotransferase